MTAPCHPPISWPMIGMLICHAHWFSMRYDHGLKSTFQKVNPFVIFDHGFWRDINWNRRVWTLAETDSPSPVPLCHVCWHTQPPLHLHRQTETRKELKSGEKHQMSYFQASIPRTAFAVGFQSVTDKRATFPFLVNQSNIIIINDMNELVGNKISTPFWQYQQEGDANL